MSISSYQDLDVWQCGMDLVAVIDQLTRRLPRDEFDLRRQMRRAAVSIPANIAEGWNRRSRGAYRLHVGIALGSQAELETEMRVAVRTGSLSLNDCEPALALTERVGRMLTNLHTRLTAPPT